MRLVCQSHSMKHLGMLQPWGYWHSKQFSLILLLAAAAIRPDYTQELDQESHHSHAPNTPGGRKGRQKGQGLWWIMSVVRQRELCVIPLSRGSFPCPPVLCSAQKGPGPKDESRHSKSECALYNLYFVAAVGRTQ